MFVTLMKGFYFDLIMKKIFLLPIIITATFMLSVFSLPAFAEDNVSSGTVAEGETFEVKLSQYDTPVQCKIEKVGGDPNLVITKDGELLFSDFVWIWGYPEDKNFNLNTIESVGAFDFNADQLDDLVIIGYTDDPNGSKCIIPLIFTGKMCMGRFGQRNDNLFCSFDGYSEYEAINNGMDFTVESVKAALLGGNADGIYTDYKDAYAQIAKVYRSAYSNASFELVYADNDDIPELFVYSDDGRHNTLYTFDKDHARCLLDSRALGWRGEEYYYYAERTGVINYYASQEEEEFSFDYYMPIPDEGPLTHTYYTKKPLYYYEDSGPLSAIKQFFFGDPTEYICETDKTMSKKEIKKLIKSYKKYDWKELKATKDYESFISELYSSSDDASALTENSSEN